MESPGEESLDFASAMADFHHMFPGMDPGLIEQVLRRNQGAVDDTIDQLLAMSLSEDPASATVPKRVDDEPPLKAGRERVDVSGTALTPANLARAALADPNRPILHMPQPNSISPDLLGSSSRRWRPPLVGRLPQDFLRLSVPRETQSLDEIYEDLDRKKSETRRKPRTSVPSGAHLGIFSTDSKVKYHKGLEHCHQSSGFSARRRKQYEETRRQAEALKDKMIENSYERQATTDPEVEKYLEDERVAIMLQNREFMKELRRNKDFVAALHRESFGDLSSGGPSLEKPRKSKTPKFRMPGSSPKIVPPYTPPPESPSARLESPLPSDMAADYGDEGPVAGLDAFPYTRDLPRDGESEEAFSQRVRHMGKTSRQKFALMARRFVRKSKGAKGVLGASDSHYSGMGLLEAAEENDGFDASDAAAASHGYNQESDLNAGISQNVDLKEGRLFSR